jgi:hypothetical protein
MGNRCSLGIEAQKATLAALLGGVVSDEMFGQLEIEIRQLHGCWVL